MNPGWILRLVFLSAAVTLLSSLSSGEEDVELVINRTTIVCSKYLCTTLLCYIMLPVRIKIDLYSVNLNDDTHII